MSCGAQPGAGTSEAEAGGAESEEDEDHGSQSESSDGDSQEEDSDHDQDNEYHPDEIAPDAPVVSAVAFPTAKHGFSLGERFVLCCGRNVQG